MDDSVVTVGLESLGVSPRLNTWHDWELAEAAWILRPERARLQASVRVADAARVAAGGRPMPEVMTETEYSFSGTGGESRWGVALSTVFTMELGGKRGARLNRGNGGLLAAMAKAQEEAWDVRWRVREAIGDMERAEHLWMASAAELALTDSLLVLMRARYDEGSVSRIELARMDADRQESALEVAARQRELENSRAGLAQRVGIPLSEIERLSLVPDSVAHCADARLETHSSRWPSTPGGTSEACLPNTRSPRPISGSRLPIVGQISHWARGCSSTTVWGNGLWPWGCHRCRSIGTVAPSWRRTPDGNWRRAVSRRCRSRYWEKSPWHSRPAERLPSEKAAIDLGATRERMRLAEAAYERGEVGRLEVMFARLELARGSRRLLEIESRWRASGLALEHAMGIWTGAPAGPKGGL